MKKKTAVLLLALIMIFTFVSCNPEASDSSVSSGSLPGEVIPPSEDKRVSMSDSDIMFAYTSLHYEFSKDYEAETSRKMGSDKIGTVTINGEANGTTSKITINGNIKIGTDSYKFENFVYTFTQSSSIPTIENGSISKNGETLAKDKVFDEFNILGDYLTVDDEDEPKKKFDTYEQTQTVKVKLVKDSTIVGSGTYTTYTSIASQHKYTYVCDFKVNEVRVQAKAHSDGENLIYEYVALGGKFFDNISIGKLNALE